jgi:hypothetical protein
VDFEAASKVKQLQLIKFVRIDLELVEIFVRSARRQLEMSQLEDYGRLLGYAAKGINAIRYLEGEISDQQIRTEIQQELEKIETLLFSPNGPWLFAAYL